MYKYQKTFGPTVVDRDGTQKAMCITGGDTGGDSITLACIFFVGGHCSHHDRELPKGDREAPEWCGFAESVFADAREIDDFRRLGLDEMTRPELLREARDLPKDKRPGPLNKTTAYQLRRALRHAALAAMEGDE